LLLGILSVTETLTEGHEGPGMLLSFFN
jgi:hypothetical protein